MDGIAAISDRIAAIRGTLAAMAPQPSAATTTAAASAPASAQTFASILAQEVAGVGGTAGPATGAVDAAGLPVQHVGDYGPQQLANAVAIVNAGKALGLSVRDQTIGVMTALGESSLTVADHGDVAGPDSRGLFQQRANGAWGSLADRMNPTVSATNFFQALTAVKGRDAMEPTAVAHAVQRNADPAHYAKYWDAAVAIVTRMAAVTAPGIAAG